MKKDMKMIVFPILGLALFAVAMFFFNREKAPETTTATPPGLNFVREGNYSLGPKDAKVTVVEFFDPECEACSAFHPVVKEVLKDFGSEIHFVARYMLYHGNSQNAAIALEAAGAQGKFWELQDILFTRQNEWSHKKESAMPYFEKYAQELQLDMNAFKASLDDMTLKANIAKDISEGQALGVKGTPSFFVNGKPLMNLSDNALRDAIVEELKRLK